MNADEFNSSMEKLFDRSRNVLAQKGAEYAPVSRFHNFDVSSAFIGGTPAQALGGFMAKHITSVYDMLRAGDLTAYTLEQWREKVGDAINYLILLNGMIDEAHPETLAADEPDVATTSQNVYKVMPGSGMIVDDDWQQATLDHLKTKLRTHLDIRDAKILPDSQE